MSEGKDALLLLKAVVECKIKKHLSCSLIRDIKMVSTMKKKRAAVECNKNTSELLNIIRNVKMLSKIKKEKAPPPLLLRLVGDVCSPPQKAGKPALWFRF